jgi:hypothetical protein
MLTTRPFSHPYPVTPADKRPVRRSADSSDDDKQNGSVLLTAFLSTNTVHQLLLTALLSAEFSVYQQNYQL